MEKKILVPTDLRIASLNSVKLAVENHVTQPVEVILMYAVYLDDSITSLLFYNPAQILNSGITDGYREALEILKNRYPGRISRISVKLFHGRSSEAVNRFIEANEIDKVFIPKVYRLKITGKGFDPVPFIRACKYPVVEMGWEAPAWQSEQEQLTALFI
jgi:hypothetical protein